jgi:hypothetical protein
MCIKDWFTAIFTLDYFVRFLTHMVHSPLMSLAELRLWSPCRENATISPNSCNGLDVRSISKAESCSCQQNQPWKRDGCWFDPADSPELLAPLSTTRLSELGISRGGHRWEKEKEVRRQNCFVLRVPLCEILLLLQNFRARYMFRNLSHSGWDMLKQPSLCGSFDLVKPTGMCVYVYMYVCMCVCIYVCMCVCMYIYIYISPPMFNINKFCVLPTESIYLFIWYLKQEWLFLYIACLLHVMQELFDFNPSVLFHRCSMLSSIYMLLLREVQMRTVEKQWFFGNRGVLGSNV